MIERTKARLEEARILLRRLQAEKFRQVQNANPTASRAFSSLLDNFIEKARTVLWVLGAEEKEKYDAWKSSPGAATSAAEDEIFRLINEMRISIKLGKPVLFEVRKEQVDIPENPDAFSGSQNFAPPDSDKPTTKIDVHYVKGTDHEVVSLCEQYLATLTRLINDFEQTHAQRKNNV
jgi:hypothetical protein